MSEFGNASLFAGEYDSNVIRQYVLTTLEHLDVKDGLHIDGIDVLRDCEFLGRSTHVALASFVVANVLQLSMDDEAEEVIPELLTQWQANNPTLTAEQVEAYGAIAAGFCETVGQPEIGDAAASYIAWTAQTVMRREDNCSNVHVLFPEQALPDFEPLALSAA